MGKYFRDVPQMVAGWIKRDWSLGPQQTPNVEYIPEKFIMNARVGTIFVYPTYMSEDIASTNYDYVTRTARVSIKVSTRMRETHYSWVDEVYRILYVNRRRGVKCMDGWEFLEILSNRPMQDLSGWYTTTIDVKFTANADFIDYLGIGDNLKN